MNIFPWFSRAEVLYKEGWSYAKIGQELNVCRKKISKALREAGYESNLKFHPGLKSTSYRKYYVEDDIFSTIDTESKAYWLGFLYADGAINSNNNVIELALAEKDYDHILKFKEFLGFNGVVSEKYKHVGEKSYKSYRLSFSSEQMKKDLIKLGCPPKKSDILTFPEEDQVPLHLLPHFIRGYVDGDGHIGQTSNKNPKVTLEVLGTEDFLIGLQNYFSSLGVNKLNLNNFKHSNIKRTMHSNADALLILNKIYKDASIYLNRKYEKYKEFAV